MIKINNKLNNKLTGNVTGVNNSFSIEGQININKQSMLDLVYNGSAESKKILYQCYTILQKKYY